MTASLQDARAELHTRLQARRGEMEEAVAARVLGIAPPSESAAPSYLEGLRAALAEALDYGMAALCLGERRAPALPTTLAAQARLAARNDVGLDTVLRRYVAGHAIFIEFVIEEAERGGLLSAMDLQRALHGYAAVFDQLIGSVSAEHAQEIAACRATAEQRRAARVRRLLAGEPIDAGDLGYEFEADHLALVAKGPGAVAAIRALAGPLGGPLLLVCPEQGFAWGWLAHRDGMGPAVVEELAGAPAPPASAVAIGELGQGIQGWRTSHRQAHAAHGVAERIPGRVARYGEVALLATMLKDDLLLESLRRTYLEPLERHREGAERLTDALEAYFSCRRNVSSAAASLRLDRRTLARRLQTAERILGKPIDLVAMELEAAMRLRRLEVV